MPAVWLNVQEVHVVRNTYFLQLWKKNISEYNVWTTALHRSNREPQLSPLDVHTVRSESSEVRALAPCGRTRRCQAETTTCTVVRAAAKMFKQLFLFIMTPSTSLLMLHANAKCLQKQSDHLLINTTSLNLVKIAERGLKVKVHLYKIDHILFWWVSVMLDFKLFSIWSESARFA